MKTKSKHSFLRQDFHLGNKAAPTVSNLEDALYGLMDEISGDLESAKQEPLVVPIDQHFNVKGIGLVAIGYVQSGSVSVHDELHLLPAEGPGTVKSLQVMDDDVDTAVAGDRVGIALRNTKEEHLTGGSLSHPSCIGR